MTTLSPDRRRQIEDLFEAALEQPAISRDRWLSERCGGDTELWAEVSALLAGHSHEGGVVDASIARTATALLPDRSQNRRVGAYRLRREIGRGGMGTVYLADRDDGQFEQQVALKILRTSDDAEDLHRRFLAERQILASLNHPNIAQLLDGGMTDDGVPYLVMEFVDGTPITTYCDRHYLSVATRLQLFRDVCAAVHHAHQNLVLHRDIKPGNIIVTADGRVKLLDFGIAKLLNPVLEAGEVPLTRTAFRPMTPGYASPEQVRGGQLSTASDVYSLGVVLYELLAGRAPYRLTKGAAHELARAVCEQEPERPSVRVTREEPPDPERPDVVPPAPDVIAAARATTVERLSRLLRGDLDAIVAMALRKEASRRYGSAELLWQDLQRHLEGLPVLAHRGSRWYRARKFLARHRGTAAAAALAAVSLVGGAGVAVKQAVVARRERDRAEQARVQAENVTSFLVGLFDATNARRPRADGLTADELVRRGAAQAEALAGNPLAQARLLEAIGRVYETMGRYTEAHDALRRSLAARTAVNGGEDAEASVTMYYLAEVLRRLSRYEEAIEISRRALAIRTRVFGERHPAVAELLWQQAQLTVYVGNDTATERLAAQALDLRRRAAIPNDSAVAASLYQYASILQGRGRYSVAESTMREAIAAHQRWQGPASREAAFVQVRLGEFIREGRGDSVEGEALVRSGVATLRSTAGNNHVTTGWALVALGDFLSARGEYAEAERVTREALTIQRNAFGADHHNTGGVMGSLAQVMTRAGRYVEAEQLRREALQIYERSLGPTHWGYATGLADWAHALADLGRFDEAISVFERSVALRGDPARNRWRFAGSRVGLAIIYARKGDYAAADSLFAEGLRLMRQHMPESHFAIRATYAEMAKRYAREGKPAEAERYRKLARPR